MRVWAARPAPSSATPQPRATMVRFVFIVTPLKLDQSMDADASLLRDRRREVVERLSVVVDEQRGRDVALMREPVGDAGNRAVACLAVEVLVWLQMIVAEERLPADRRFRCEPDGIAPPVDLRPRD